MTRNQLDYWKLQEEKRANRAQEREAHRRTNKESQDRRIAAYLDRKIRLQQIKMQDQHNLRQDYETQRSNIERERQNVINLVTDQSRVQATLAGQSVQREVAGIQAGVGYANVGAQYASIAEMQRANQAREALQLQQQLEVMRSNLNNEELKWAQQQTSQQRATTDYLRYQLDADKWSSIGKAQAYSQQALTWAQTNESWSRTDLNKESAAKTKAQTVESYLRSGINIFEEARRLRSYGKQ